MQDGRSPFIQATDKACLMEQRMRDVMNKPEIKRNQFSNHHRGRHQRRRSGWLRLRLGPYRSQHLRRRRESSGRHAIEGAFAIWQLFRHHKCLLLMLNIPLGGNWNVLLRVVLAQTTRNRQRLTEYTLIPSIAGNTASLAYP